jgi:ferritin
MYRVTVSDVDVATRRVNAIVDEAAHENDKDTDNFLSRY